MFISVPDVRMRVYSSAPRRQVAAGGFEALARMRREEAEAHDGVQRSDPYRRRRR